MGILDDSDSEYDSSISSSGDWGEEKQKEEESDYKAPNVLKGNMEQRVSAVLELKDEMGVEQDPDYIKKEARKQATKDAIVNEKKKEKKAMKNMTTAERVEYQKENVGNMMNRIRQKREQSKKDVFAENLGDSKMKRNSSNQSLDSCSMHSVSSTYTVDTTGMEQDELSEFQRLKAKKNRRSKKRASKKPAKAVST